MPTRYVIAYESRYRSDGTTQGILVRAIGSVRSCQSGVGNNVAYIICEPCIGTKDTACVDVCPVDCIHPRKDEAGFEASEMLFIHPDECIDCGACVPACPAEAIFALDETPEKWARFIAVNGEYFRK